MSLRSDCKGQVIPTKESGEEARHTREGRKGRARQVSDCKGESRKVMDGCFTGLDNLKRKSQCL